MVGGLELGTSTAVGLDSIHVQGLKIAQMAWCSQKRKKVEKKKNYVNLK